MRYPDQDLERLARVPIENVASVAPRSWPFFFGIGRSSVQTAGSYVGIDG